MSNTISLARFSETASQIRAEYLAILIPILEDSPLTEVDVPQLTTTLMLEAKSNGEANLVAKTELIFVADGVSAIERQKVVDQLFERMPQVLVL